MDGDQVRRLALRVGALAEEVRAAAARVAAASGVRWQSTSAAAFRERLGEQTVQVRRAAVAVDDVAAALNAHARAVEASTPDVAGAVAGAVVRAASGGR
jgi:hypothetical protein